MKFIVREEPRQVSDDKDKLSVGSVIGKALASPGDYATFLLGTAAGVALDIASAGVSLGQGTLLGGTAALGTKKLYEAANQKKVLRKQCLQLKAYYKRKNDQVRVGRLDDLIERIDIITAMSSSDIEKEILAIQLEQK